MTAEEAIKFIHQRTWQGSKPGLSRTRELLSLLGDPHKDIPFVHIAGTNGKGSTAAMLSAILRAAGYRTGLYTSPYITRFNERIQIDGAEIPDASLGEITEKCAPLALSMADRPTEFELVTAVAFEYFRQEKCDIVVLETGLGGRLDSTNVIEAPLCSVITNIGLDHTRELGGTVEEIAGEKAGIIKSGRPAVIYDLPENIRDVFSRKCAETGSALISSDFCQIIPDSDSVQGQRFSYKDFSGLFLPLLGEHQLKNAAVALETVSLLRSLGWKLTDGAVRRGLASTRWPARFEIVSRKPLFIVDGGHNPQCAETVAYNLFRYFPGRKTVLLMGVLRDKDYMSMARILNPRADAFVTVTPDSPRALDAQELARSLDIFGKPAIPCASIDGGIETALSLAGEDGLVCSVGSLYFAGTVRNYFLGSPE